MLEHTEVKWGKKVFSTFKEAILNRQIKLMVKYFFKLIFLQCATHQKLCNKYFFFYDNSNDFLQNHFDYS